MLTAPKNVILKDVTINWARLDTPAENPFGGAPNWELQAVFPTKEAAQAAQAEGITVKEKDGVFTASLRRKSVTKEGMPMEPVRVVDAAKQAMDGAARRRIGNNSKGNIIVWVAPYDYRGRKGVTSSLTAVQIIHLEEYTGGNAGIDFDMVATEEGSPSEGADLF